MKHTLTILLISFSLLVGHTATRAQRGRRGKSSLNQPQVFSLAQRQAAEQALARLRALRSGWHDVNRQFIDSHFVRAQKYDGRAYAIQYLEAKDAVGNALQILPRSELRAAIQHAMDIFEDLELITEIFRKSSPITTNVRVTAVFPYLKKYNVPYEKGVTTGDYALMLHQDFVLSYILPLRFALVNRVEALLGGKVEALPPLPTYEQMFGVPKQPAIPKVTAEELKEIARQAIDARLQGNRERMQLLLDVNFLAYGREGVVWDKEFYLRKMAPDGTVKGFEIVQSELRVWNYRPSLSVEVRYESLLGKFKTAKYAFTFADGNGKWLIASWRSA
jgi:hypothetical protein